MKRIKETTYKGTNILLGNRKREVISKMVEKLVAAGFEEISIPIIQFESTFEGKVGEENNNMMFTLTDRGNRKLCLAPEYTAVIQKLASTTFKYQKDVKLFYVQECFRGESPQKGRYRQFTQLGVEILNPTKDWRLDLIDTAISLYADFPGVFVVNNGVTRGLDYYEEGKGFEITYPALGTAQQLVGGGAYEGGIGFAIGIDRLLLIDEI
jgi:histidyl-tRNA synthetase